MSNITIEALPVELFHRIFDELDAQTILYSIRPLSRLFYSIVNTYNRYILNFNLISKRNFYFFCKLIHPWNIISLTLANDEQTLNQIDLFISLVNLQQFTRLRSLILINIGESQLNFILKRINLNFLTSFSFNINDKLIETAASLLSLTIKQTTLHKLEFNTCYKIPKISWPNYSITEYLFSNNRINIIDLCRILQYSPYLHTIIMNEIPKGIIHNLTSKYFQQLTSLIIKNFSTTIDELELFLLLTPSLVYFQLIGGVKMIDGKRWEQFIQINLPQLDKFEFYITVLRSNEQTLIDLKLALASFQTPFWIEHKKWFVACEYVLRTRIISFYSIPICTSHMYYTAKSDKIFVSTYPTAINSDLITMDHIKSLSLSLNKSLMKEIKEKHTMTCYPLFGKVTEIDLQFYHDWPVISLRSILIFIDISRIVHIKLSSDYSNEYCQNLLIDLKIFLEQAYNLFSLSIHGSFYRYKLYLTAEDIHSIVPYHVQYLQIPIDDLNQINMILERCQNLSIIELDIEGIEFCESVINWFTDNTIGTTCRQNGEMITVWLGKKRIQATKLGANHKRIKLQ